jgi:1-deoxy-D-xylulose 5-phosphate reductoisomerase
MRRVNIKTKGTLLTISFQSKEQFQSFLNERLGFGDIAKDTADKVWDLNVGAGYKVIDYTFAIQSKARVGNHFVL